jgi:hypothetical protein
VGDSYAPILVASDDGGDDAMIAGGGGRRLDDKENDDATSIMTGTALDIAVFYLVSWTVQHHGHGHGHSVVCPLTMIIMDVSPPKNIILTLSLYAILLGCTLVCICD